MSTEQKTRPVLLREGMLLWEPPREVNGVNQGSVWAVSKVGKRTHHVVAAYDSCSADATLNGPPTVPDGWRVIDGDKLWRRLLQEDIKGDGVTDLDLWKTPEIIGWQV